MPKKQSPLELFKTHAVPGSTPAACWTWTGHTSANGYGLIGQRVNGKKVKIVAHRFAYEQAKGLIPKGLNVLHTCDNPPCCNPLHLVAGTQTQNMQDMTAKGRRSRVGQFKKKFTPEQRKEMLRLWAFGLSQKQIGEMFGLSQTGVSIIVNE